MSLDSDASTAGPSTLKTRTINSDGQTNALRTLSGDIAPVDLPCAETAGSPSIPSQVVSQLEPNEQEAEILLVEFKTNMTEQFPFVVIRPDSTSQTLHHERPLLWKAIMVAASHGTSDRQMALGADLMEDLTTRLLFRAEKSLDVLQALLIFIAWYELSAL